MLELVENLARRDLNPEEEADGFITLVRDRDVEVAEVAHRVGRSPAYVSKRIRVFEDADLRSAVVDGAISVSEAEELVIVGDVAQRHDLLARLRAEDWDRARLRAEIRLLSQPADTRVADVAADSRTDAKWPPGMELDVDDGVDFDAEWNADAPAGLHEVMPRPRDLRMQVVRVTTTLKKSALLQQMTTLAAVLENLRPWQLTAGDDQALSELFLVLEGAGAQRTVNALSETLRRLARSSRERRLHLPTIADAEAAAAQRRGTRGG